MFISDSLGFGTVLQERKIDTAKEFLVPANTARFAVVQT